MAVTDDAIAAIRSMIMSGELKPGDRLPPEAQLSERLGLSRNSLREAVKALALLRVLDVRQGDGTFVTSLAPNTLVETLSFVIDLHQDSSIVDLLGVRRILEAEATHMAATRLGPKQIAQLAVLAESVNSQSSVEELVEADMEFHRTINAASGNAYLAATLEGLSGATSRARIWRGVTEDGAIDRTLAEHRAIVSALRMGRADLARSWATVHVSGVEMWVSSQLGKDQI
ncbi:FadR/GntR family transcriptional regulator [Timonella senegalensis]|uniref:FadR/GntR family transcriptional regulator n=1 Tax=Timonella senegalensis TaxID=1465825 RepID=UPI0002F3A2D3|nr:FadR/GntR family transcriptional regulator [Timonella senegalensis]